MSVWKWLALLLLLAVLTVAALWLWGQWRWRGLTEGLHTELQAARRDPQPVRYDSTRELPGLPEPVQRYFRAVLPEGAPMVAAAFIAHRGSFNTGENVDAWKPFTSTQQVVTQRPGFVWDGRVHMLPGLVVHVHDAYVAGVGLLRPALAGVFTLAELRGTPEVAEGELMRYFAEAAWYPTALLPSQGVRWQAVDAQRARATLTDGALSLSLTFTFGDDGLISRVRADARGRTVGGRTVPTPWEGRWSDYGTRDGMTVPGAGEVAWLLPALDGASPLAKPYWRGTVTALRYEFAAPAAR